MFITKIHASSSYGEVLQIRRFEAISAYRTHIETATGVT